MEQEKNDGQKAIQIFAKFIIAAYYNSQQGEALVIRLRQAETVLDTNNRLAQEINHDRYIDNLIRQKLINQIHDCRLRAYYGQAIESMGKTDIINTENFKRYFWEYRQMNPDEIDLNNPQHTTKLVYQFLSWLRRKSHYNSIYKLIELRCLDISGIKKKDIVQTVESWDKEIDTDNGESFTLEDTFVPPTLSELDRISQEQSFDIIRDFIENDPTELLRNIYLAANPQCNCHILANLYFLDSDFNTRCYVDVLGKNLKKLPKEEIECIRREYFFPRIESIESKFKVEILRHLPTDWQGKPKLFTAKILATIFNVNENAIAAGLRPHLFEVLREEFGQDYQEIVRLLQ